MSNEKRKFKNGTTNKKTGTKPSVTGYPALNPKKNIRNRQSLIDYDYLEKLTTEELQWLNDFTEEYTNAGFKSKRKKNRILKKKSDIKASVDRNNARNRDLQNVIEMFPGLNKVDLSRYEDLAVLTEDDIIALIDLARQIEKGED